MRWKKFAKRIRRRIEWRVGECCAVSRASPSDHSRISPVAKLALVCGILAPFFVLASRWARAIFDQPGDDTFFILLLAGPIVAAVGLLLAIIARSSQRNGVVTAALWINAIWLAIYVGTFVFGLASYSGR